MGKQNLILVLLLLAILIGLTKSFDIHESDLESDHSLWDLYERWRSEHRVSTDLGEKQTRFNVFKQNAKFIHEFNKQDKPYKLKMNEFGDMTSHELMRSYAGSKVKHYRLLHGERSSESFMYEHVQNVPSSVDWRKKGAVTGVKDQGQCGSCWAFSTVVGVEGINQIKTKKLVSLSEQELVDCDKQNNQGCNGGLMELAFDFIKKNGGITTEQNYPYRAKDGTCNRVKENVHNVMIDGHENVPTNNEDALMKAVAHQPVSVAIDAGSSEFQFYSEGVYNGNCGTELDHGVGLVGYGATVDGTKYWIVKNSWGTEWGEKGYIRIQRGVPAKEGHCGIAMEGSYPIKSSVSQNESKLPSQYKEEL